MAFLAALPEVAEAAGGAAEAGEATSGATEAGSGASGSSPFSKVPQAGPDAENRQQGSGRNFNFQDAVDRVRGALRGGGLD